MCVCVCLRLEIKPNRLFLVRRFAPEGCRRFAGGLLKWRFRWGRQTYRRTEAPRADRHFPLTTTLTSTSRSSKTSQRSSERTRLRGRCPSTRPGRFGWTGETCSVLHDGLRLQGFRRGDGEGHGSPQASVAHLVGGCYLVPCTSRYSKGQHVCMMHAPQFTFELPQPESIRATLKYCLKTFSEHIWDIFLS